MLCLKNRKLDQEKSGRSKVRNQGVSGREIHVIVEGLDRILSGLQVNWMVMNRESLCEKDH